MEAEPAVEWRGFLDGRDLGLRRHLADQCVPAFAGQVATADVRGRHTPPRRMNERNLSD